MTPEELIYGMTDLASLPDAVIRANELLDSPHAGADEIGDVISLDPALSARLLKLVNSAFYSSPGQVDTISRAITVIGTTQLRSLITASSATQIFKDVDLDLIDMNSFWHRSVYCGLVAKKSAAFNKRGNKGEAQFLTGLLHDIGRLVLLSQQPDLSRQILRESHDRVIPTYKVEQQYLGFTSADISSTLLASWKLPRSLWEPIQFQHTPELAKEHIKEAHILRLALAITDCLEPELKSGEPLNIADLEETELNGETLSTEQLGMIAMDANMESFDVLNIINPTSSIIY